MKTKSTLFTVLLAGLLFSLLYSCQEITDLFNQSNTPDTVTDVDGNVYNTVTIGTQVWMVENLKTTKYNDGTSIPSIIESVPTGYYNYCWYNNDINNKNPYGALYGYGVVHTRILAPIGWHVPDMSDWQILLDYLGENATYKLMETGTSHWLAPNTEATNESGFTALPGGMIYNYSFNFVGMGYLATWWSSNTVGCRDPRYEILHEGKIGFNDERALVSVRCLKDALPILTTLPITDITSTTAKTGGDITNVGGLKITTCGVCWHSSHNPTIDNFKTVDKPYENREDCDPEPVMGIGIFTSTITGLKPNKTYYVRTYATNNMGTAYGQELSFTTLNK